MKGAIKNLDTIEENEMLGGKLNINSELWQCIMYEKKFMKWKTGLAELNITRLLFFFTILGVKIP